MKVMLPVCLLFTLIIATDAHAQLRVSASNQQQSLDCKGQSVRVLGSLNQLTLSGQCTRLEIDGSDNVVSVEAVDDIDVNGQRNRVSWQRTIGDGRSPRVVTTGPENTITQIKAAKTDDSAAAPKPALKPAAKPVTKPATPPVSPREPTATPRPPATAATKPATNLPKAAPVPNVPAPSTASKTLSSAWVVEGSTLRLPGNSHRETVDCDGRDILILGNSNTVTVRGHCALIAVPGGSNLINAESVTSIRAEGDGNEFTWRSLHNGREPEVSLLGRRNRVNRIK